MLQFSDRIVVTGGSGFLGGFVIQTLRAQGFHNLAPLSRKDYDLTNETDVRRLYNTEKPRAIIHLAAEVGGIGANRANPGRFFYANMAMGLNMIEGARAHGIEKFVQVGTICAYPKFTPVPFKEANLWDGYPEETNAPYGIAKKALLVMCQAYREQYGLNAVYLLPVNLYGPGDNFDPGSSHVIPAIVRKCVEARRANAQEIVAWGTGQASREFLYVEDCAEAIVLALEKYNQPEPVNLGSGMEIKVSELASKIARMTGYEGKITWDASKPDGQPRRCLDVSRAREAFGFTAKTSFEDGLKRTIQWYENKVRSENTQKASPCAELQA